jgi:hypothetical protein
MSGYDLVGELRFIDHLSAQLAPQVESQAPETLQRFNESRTRLQALLNRLTSGFSDINLYRLQESGGPLYDSLYSLRAALERAPEQVQGPDAAREIDRLLGAMHFVLSVAESVIPPVPPVPPAAPAA